MDHREPDKVKLKGKGSARRATFAIFCLFVIVLFFRSTFLTVQVTGNSMLTTFNNGQRLLACKNHFLMGEIQPGDVIVFKLEPNSEYIIKRVYKVEGQQVDWLNVPRTWKLGNGKFIVPEHCVYVLGDNRSESEDSRFFGPVSTSSIMGKVITVN